MELAFKLRAVAAITSYFIVVLFLIMIVTLILFEIYFFLIHRKVKVHLELVLGFIQMICELFKHRKVD